MPRRGVYLDHLLVGTAMPLASHNPYPIRARKESFYVYRPVAYVFYVHSLFVQEFIL